ncbi:MAG: MFS transporter [Gammaproteobacteria bacterium]|nr:MFS transporter [Gammaproteobacteria bacterium]
MIKSLTQLVPEQRKDLLLLSLCLALQMSGNALIITSTALVGYALASDQSLATLPLAAQFIATMLTAIPASLLMGKIGRKAGFIIGAVIASFSGVLAVVSIVNGSFMQFCIAAVGIGVFNGFSIYYRFAAIEVVDKDYKAQAISLVLAGGVLAAVVGPNVANWSSGLFSSAEYAGGYAVITGFYVLSILLLSMINFPAPQKYSLSSGRPLKEIIFQREFIVAILSGMMGYAVMSLVMTATPLAMKHHAHAFSDTSFVIQWHVLGMFAPSFFTGSLINRYGLNNIMLTGAFLGVLCVLINLLGHTFWHFWIALFCLGISWNFLYIGATDMLTETYREEEKARAQAVNDFMVFGTVAFASLTAGYLQSSFGWRVVNIGVIPLLVIIISSLLWLRFSADTKPNRLA